MFNKIKSFLVAVGLISVGVPAMHAASLSGLSLPVATIPAELDTLLTDVGTTWTTVKGLVLGFIVFGVIVFVVLKVRSKKGS